MKLNFHVIISLSLQNSHKTGKVCNRFRQGRPRPGHAHPTARTESETASVTLELAKLYREPQTLRKTHKYSTMLLYSQ